MLIILVVSGVWYTGRNLYSAPRRKNGVLRKKKPIREGEEPLMTLKVYAALLGAGLLLALLLR